VLGRWHAPFSQDGIQLWAGIGHNNNSGAYGGAQFQHPFADCSHRGHTHADSLSDALGIHISEESENKHTSREIWESTLSTFLSKFFFALTFAIPVLVLKLDTAIFLSIAWGLSLLGLFSFYIAREQKANPWKVISEHILISLIVIFAANYAGGMIHSAFG